jgi:acyl transferase domain-containing protein
MTRERAVPIAITGMAARFPSEHSPTSFGPSPREGRDAIRPRPADRRCGFEGLLQRLTAEPPRATQ